MTDEDKVIFAELIAVRAAVAFALKSKAATYKNDAAFVEDATKQVGAMIDAHIFSSPELQRELQDLAKKQVPQIFLMVTDS